MSPARTAIVCLVLSWPSLQLLAQDWLTLTAKFDPANSVYTAVTGNPNCASTGPGSTPVTTPVTGPNFSAPIKVFLGSTNCVVAAGTFAVPGPASPFTMRLRKVSSSVSSYWQFDSPLKVQASAAITYTRLSDGQPTQSSATMYITGLSSTPERDACRADSGLYESSKKLAINCTATVVRQQGADDNGITSGGIVLSHGTPTILVLRVTLYPTSTSGLKYEVWLKYNLTSGPAVGCALPTAKGGTRAADGCDATVTSVEPALASLEDALIGPFPVRITGAGLPTSGRVSFGPGITVSNLRFSTDGTWIEAQLEGFKTADAGYKDVSITDAEGNLLGGGKSLFYLTDYTLDADVIQTVPGTFGGTACEAEPCVAEHNTVVTAWVRRVCYKASGCPAPRDEKATALLHLRRDGQPQGTPLSPGGGGAKILQFDQKPDVFTGYWMADQIKFWFTASRNNQLVAGKYDFCVTVNAINPGDPPAAGTAADPYARNKNLLSCQRDQRFAVSTGRLRIALFAQPCTVRNPTCLGVNEMRRQVAGAMDFARAVYPVSASRFEAEVIRGTTIQYDENPPISDQDDLQDFIFNQASAQMGTFLARERNAGRDYTHLALFVQDMKMTAPGMGKCYNRYPWEDVTCLAGQPTIMINWEDQETSSAVFAHELGHHHLLGDTYKKPSATSTLNPITSNCEITISGCPAEYGTVDTLSENMSFWSGGVGKLAASDLRYVKRDLMGNAARTDRWIDARTWKYLLKQYMPGAATPDLGRAEQAPAAVANKAEPTGLIYIGGILRSDGQLTWQPFLRTASAIAQESASGGSPSYTVEVQDGSGRTLASTPTRIGYWRGEGVRESRYASFALTLPEAPGTSQIVLKKDGVPIGSRKISANPPTVRLYSPNGGENLDGVVTVSWAGFDLDADELTYTVMNSSDDGATWQPLVMGIKGTSYAWDTALSAGSAKGRIKVIANDGLNEGEAASAAAFTVAEKGPAVGIDSPADNAAVAQGPVEFRVSGYDAVDGTLGDDALVVSSDRDGRLGTGRVVRVNSLSAGTHVITVTGVNARGVKGSASIRITFGTEPRITSLSPDSGAAGTSVTIYGANLGATAADNTVQFDGVKATVTSASGTTVVATVPSGLAAGVVKVTVTVAGAVSNALDFTLTGGGGTGSAGISPGSLDFGTVTVGLSKELSLTARNTGNTAVTISSGTFTNAQFAFAAGALPVTIAAGQSTTIGVKFTPSSAGEVTGSLSIAGTSVSLRGTGASAGGGGGAGTYTLARIEVTRSFVDASWLPAIGVLPGKQTLGAAERTFQMGWEFTWPADSNANRNRGSALVTLTRLPTSVNPAVVTIAAPTAALAASMVGDWYTTGYGVDRDHTISLDGAAGKGQWSTVQDPSGAYHGAFEVSNVAAIPAANASGEVIFTINATLRFGSDHWAQAEIKLVYTASGAGPSSCTYQFSATSAEISSLNQGRTFTVTPSPSSCQWAALPNEPWLFINGGPNYSGQSSVNWTALANTTGTARRGALTVAGQTFTIQQAASGGGTGGGTTCSYSLSATSATAPAAGGGGSVTLTAGNSQCAWSAASNATWLSLLTPSSNTGTSTVYWSAQANTSTASRTGTLTLAGLTYTVTQAGSGTGGGGGGGSYALARIEVTRTFDATWTQEIATLPGKQTVGPGERTFQLGWDYKWGDANANYNRTSALLTLSTVPGTVTVGSTAALAASMVGDWYTTGYGVTRDHSISLSGAAGTGQWSTAEDPSGVYHGAFTTSGSTAAPAAGSNGEVALTVNARLNFGGDHWGQAEIKLIYTQGGAGGSVNCTYSLASASGSVGSGAGSGSVQVTASPATCRWPAVVSTGTWLARTSSLNNTGSATVQYTVQANTSSAARTATLTLAGLTYTVTQSGTGGGGTFGVSTIFSDTFSRSASDICALGASDNALGGLTRQYYVPLWPTTAARAQGAKIVDGWLVNAGTDFGGVAFADPPGGCTAFAANIGQGLDIRMDVVTPSTGGLVTQAGPFFRSRAAFAGDGIIGGTSAGYWVQLHSTGEVKVKQLNPQTYVATSPAPARFDANATHQLRAAVLGVGLTVWLDGVQVISTTIGTTSGSNDGAAGIAFGAEPNRGQIGGQKVRNLVVAIAGAR